MKHSLKESEGTDGFAWILSNKSSHSGLNFSRIWISSSWYKSALKVWNKIIKQLRMVDQDYTEL